MSQENKKFETSRTAFTPSKEHSQENISGTMFCSVSNFVSGLGNPNFLQNLPQTVEKGSSGQTTEPIEANREFHRTTNDMQPSSSKMHFPTESFSSKFALDFESEETKDKLTGLPELEFLPETIVKDKDFCAYDVSYEEKLRQYRQSVEIKNSEAEAFVEEEYGYFNGKLVSSQEAIKSLSEQNFENKRTPTYSPDVLEDIFLEDGQDVIQLLSKPANIEDFAIEVLNSLFFLSKEEPEFLELLDKKYDFQEITPEDDIIKYLEGPEYLEDIYGLPELHSTRDRVMSGQGLTMRDKQKTLDRLVLLKNHMSSTKP